MPNRFYPILYDLALTLSGHVRVRPLLDAVLQRLLFHTGLPAGFIYLHAPEQGARLAAAIGDYALQQEIGKPLTVPRGNALADWEATLPSLKGRYQQALYLPIGKSGGIVLLGQEPTTSRIVQYFSPLSANLERAIKLCRSHEAQHDSLMARLRLQASVTENAQNGVVITDAERRIVDINPAFTEITGYSREEALGQTPRLLSSGRHNREFYDQMNRQLSETGRWQGKIWNRRKNGEVFPEILSISAVRDETGRITHYISIFTDISELHRVQDQINILANFDPLTMLGNRKTFLDHLADALDHAASRHGRGLAVVYLDIDGFGAINQELGQEASDQLLIAIAQQLRMAMSPGEPLARLGGDEFAMLFHPALDAEATRQRCEALLAGLAAHPFQHGDTVVHLSASLGYTLFPQDNSDAETLLRHANEAMLAAKRAGRNRAIPFDAQQHLQLAEKQQRLLRIEQAMQAGELRLHYQPKIDLRSGAVIGVEALMRWQHPERGMVPPMEFLPLAEESGLIVDLGWWALEEALRQLGEWQTQGIVLPIALNLCGRHLLHAQFIPMLRAALARHPGLPASLIEFEILESSALGDIAQARSIIQQARELGVSFALDDFGTGYSSLSYLKQLPVETVKLDQSFIRSLLDDFDNLPLVRAVSGMTQAFNRRLVAEGVETVEHGMLLLQLGCELVQGYGFARPMPAGELPRWLTEFKLDPRLRLAAEQVWSPNDYPLLIASYYPRDHLRRLRQALAGTPLLRAFASIPIERNERRCGIGLWFEQPTTAVLATSSEFQAARQQHREFMALMQQALDHLRAGTTEAAAALLPRLDAKLADWETALAALQQRHLATRA